MAEWAPKRFWKEAEVSPAEGGHTVLLDGRQVKTPAKAALVMPTAAMARAVAGEWDTQQDRVRPETMPVTRAVNSAIDRVRPQQDEVAALIAAYGDSDLICYRAEGPEALCARQCAAWDPLVDWARDALEAPLVVVAGVIYRPQPAPSVAAMRARVAGLDAFELTALHDLVSLSGSLVIGLAATEDWADPEDLWARSRIDETWQQELWGADEEAVEAAETKKAAFLQARRFFDLARNLS
ncbi:chaperone required for assembly of F1-ATPase [Rhodovulum iodosum]|uniref:Chaperone required for assembly of F1-ATPase n=1 Tax=Rhodovulum iodosum TaxID=68291 RepID=A0ABV3XXL5_9RHOB|nr:ATP12 family protein [Rhodovulum robiginosum]RSK38058.1 ATPase [Rhodovulum robiginosum]